MIERAIFKDLHGIYNYDISFKESVTVLTGPNGYGKTTILKIIAAVHDCDYEYLCKLTYSRISLYYRISNGRMVVHIKKDVQNESVTESEDQGSVYQDSIKVSLSKLNEDSSEEYVEEFPVSLGSRSDDTSFYSYYTILEGKRIVRRNNNKVIFDPDECRNFDMFIKEQKCSFIAEQRVIKTGNDSLGETSISNTIEDIADELKQSFNECQVNFGKQSQSIDASFMSRLISGDYEVYTEDAYAGNIVLLRAKMDKLREYGLVPTGTIVESYPESQRSVLSLYLQDMYKKLSAFDSFFDRLSLFDSVVSSKMLSHKKMRLDSKDGLSIIDDNYRIVPLDKLSSGEQNLIILYYKLVFLNNSRSILLIDEPENSLHVAWMTKMLADYKNVSKLLGCQILLATHSPAFINNNWDITYDLEDNCYQD